MLNRFFLEVKGTHFDNSNFLVELVIWMLLFVSVSCLSSLLPLADEFLKLDNLEAHLFPCC